LSIQTVSNGRFTIRQDGQGFRKHCFILCLFVPFYLHGFSIYSTSMCVASCAARVWSCYFGGLLSHLPSAKAPLRRGYTFGSILTSTSRLTGLYTQAHLPASTQVHRQGHSSLQACHDRMVCPAWHSPSWLEAESPFSLPHFLIICKARTLQVGLSCILSPSNQSTVGLY